MKQPHAVENLMMKEAIRRSWQNHAAARSVLEKLAGEGNPDRAELLRDIQAGKHLRVVD